MDSNCGCEIKKNLENIPVIEIDINGVGEEIFKDDDLFEKVKNFYEHYEDKDKNLEDKEEDFLLDNLKPKDKNPDLEFVNYLINLKPKNIEILDNKEKKEIEKKEIETLSDSKNYKIKYIKNYLKNLKDGS